MDIEIDKTDLNDALSILDEQFSKLTTFNEVCVDYDPILSVAVITALDHLYGDGGLAERREELESFCRQRSDRLSHILSASCDAEQNPLLYRETEPYPFLRQPEALMIFHLLELDKFKLRQEWIKHYPVKELEKLAIKWGTPYAT